MTKNVLFISHSSELNGAERALLDILVRIDRDRFRPFLAVPRSGPLAEEARKADAAVFTVPSKWWLTERSKIWKQPFSWIWNLRSVLAMVRLIKNERIDLVFTNSAVNWSGAFAARKTGIPHVWSIHEILAGRTAHLGFLLGKRKLIRWMENLSDRIVANSFASARAFQRSGKASIVSNGIASCGRDVPNAGFLKDTFGFAENKKTLAIVGKIYPEKGQETTILALKSLLPRRPDLILLVIGAPGRKRYFKKIRGIVRRQGLEKNVIFTGYRTDWLEILPLLTAVIVASSVDSLGRAALEAMAAGVPVLAVAEGGLPDIVDHLRTGYLADAQTPEAIAAGLSLILDDPAGARQIGEAGRKFVESEFPLDGMIRKIERLLEDCLER